MLPYRIKKIYRPEIFQGHNKKKNYFEGWYFKLADKQTSNIFAIIPGVSISGISNDSHSFIQVMDGKNATSKYFRFNFNDFRYSTDKFQVNIGNNSFSRDRLNLDLKDGQEIFNADLEFYNLNTWPKHPLSPGAMGWYAFVPFMECYHGVVSMSHIVEGSGFFSGKKIDFSGGKGYIEKDWGQSFPQAWIWLQSNHFQDEGSSIMLSIARIPWRGRSFTGFICGMLHRQRLHIFATYNGSRIKHLQSCDNKFKCIIENKYQRISIEALKETSAVLLSPVLGAMDGRINESIDAKVKIRLESISNPGRKEIDSHEAATYEDTGYAGGLEIIRPEVL